MRAKISKIKKEQYLPPILFLMLSLFFLFPAILSPGIFVGGDWAFPYTKAQSLVHLKSITSAWKTGTLIGKFEPLGASLPITLVMHLLFLIGFSGPAVSKLFILFCFFIAGYGMYLLLKYLGVEYKSAFLAGFFYQTAPFLFDLSVLGWGPLLLALCLLPLFILFFIKSVREESLVKLAISFLIYALAMGGSTTVIWYTLVIGSLFFSFYKDRNILVRYIGYSLLLYLFLILTNSHWLLNLLLSKDARVFGSENVLSSVSRGMWIRFKFLNIIRGWGSIFNFSYESSYPKFLTLISFSGFLIAVYSLIKIKLPEKFSKISLLAILGYPLILFILGSYRLSKIPFTNIIRDPGRNVALISLVTAILLGFFLNYFFEKNKKIFYLAIILVFLNAVPYFLGRIYQDTGFVENIKLRTFKYPQDYLDLENFLSSQHPKDKILMVPITGGSQDYTDQKYYGDYHGFYSTFRELPQAQGYIKLTDKEKHGSNNFYYTFSEGLMKHFNENIIPSLKKLDISYLTFEFDKMSWEDWYFYDQVVNSGLFEDVTESSLGYQSKHLALYKVKDPSAEIRVNSNFILSNESAVFVYQPLLDRLNDYEILYQKDLNLNSSYPMIIMPKRHYSVDLSNIKPPDFSLPLNVKPPSNLLPYRLMIRTEQKRADKALNYQEEFNILLSANSARLAEVVLHPDSEISISFQNYVDNYFRLKDVMASVPLKERDLDYYLLLQQMFTHINYADSVFEKDDLKPYRGISYSDENKQTLYDDFKKWLEKKTVLCQGICFFFDQTPLNLELKSANVKDKSVLIPEIDSQNQDGVDKIYSLESQNKELITYQQLQNNKIYQPSEVKNDGTLDSLLNIIGYSLQKTEQENFVKNMSNVTYFELDKSVPELDYEFSFIYQKDNPQVGIAVIEEYAKLKDDFVVGAKEDNYDLVTRMAYFLEPSNPEKVGENLYRVTRILQSQPSTNKFYVVLFNTYSRNGKLLLNDFNFGIKKLPVVYYEKNMGNINTKQADYNFTKISSSEYKVDIGLTDSDIALVLDQQYNSGWQLQNSRGNKINAEHVMANGYANSWIIPADQTSQKFVIVFKPQRYSKIGLQITIISYGIIFALLFYKTIFRKV